MTMKTDISIVLCTYNRASRFGSVLGTLAKLEAADGLSHEILVVDNNSNDGTRAVVEAAMRSHPGRIRYAFESRQGLSWARNKGIEEARGGMIAFTDDDVVVDPVWLAALARASSAYPHVGFGGRVIPVWDFTPPSWFVRSGPFQMLKGGVVVGHDLGDKPLEYNNDMRSPVGANMAFRREVFERHGLFRTDLGKVGKRAFFAEDAEFFQRLLDAGERALYYPKALIYHPVDREKMTKRHFVVSYFNLGRSIGRLDHYPARAIRYFGIPRYLARMLFDQGGRCVVAVLRFRYKEMLYNLFESCWLSGQIFETFHLSFSRSDKRWPSDRMSK
jgi:glycosyltransferase involved in cell wall biosynthesis